MQRNRGEHDHDDRRADERRRRIASLRLRAARETVVLYALVALGTSIGGTLRATASLAATGLAGAGFPWGTLFVNIAGSFAITLYAALTGPDGRLLATSRQRHFVMTGLCGGFTTFSLFSVETLRFLQSGQAVTAGLSVALSATAWLTAAWLGHLTAQRLNRPGGR